MPKPTRHKHPDPLRRRSILWQTVLYAVVGSTLLVIALSAASYLFASTLLEQQTLNQLKAIATHSEDRLQDQLERVRARARLTAELIGAQFDVSTMQSLNPEVSLATVFEERRDNGGSLQALHVFDADGKYVNGRGPIVELPSPPPQDTALLPVIGLRGWESFDIVSPIFSPGGNLEGWLVVNHSATNYVHNVQSSLLSLGETDAIFLSIDNQGELMLLEHGDRREESYTVSIGLANRLHNAGAPVALAAHGGEGSGYYMDYNGNRVLAAYRYLPLLGWGLTVKINYHEAIASAVTLANVLMVVGILFTCIAVLLSFSLARHLTKPLLDVSHKVSRLKPGHWAYRRTVHTGDEVEDLDTDIAQLTARLRKLYERLEDEVALRSEQLRQEYAKDRTILASLNLGILVIDKKGVVTEANETASEILKLNMKKVMGAPATDLLGLRRRNQTMADDRNPITQCLRTRKAVHVSPHVYLNITLADGTYMPARLSVTPLLEGRKLLGAIVQFQDMTSERQLEYMKAEFISLASHQLRTPLSTMQWYLELLSGNEDKNLTEEQQSFVTELMLASHRMNNIVTELMDASRLQRGVVDPVFKDVDLGKLIKNASSDMQSRAHEKKVALKAHVPSGGVKLRSDPMMLNIVLQNLLNNAIKYNQKDGSVGIVLRSAKDTVTVEVKDNGIGIPRADQDRIFQKLFRARNARESDVNGSGLGLYSAKMIAEKLGGTLTFKSVEGKGSTFTVVLPKRSPADDESEKKRAKRTRKKSTNQ